MKNKLIPEFANTFKVRRRDWYINFKWAFLNTENTNYICALTKKLPPKRQFILLGGAR